MAYVDSLTGLGNRRAFDLHLEREWALALRDGIDSFVVVADLDRFKQLNDSCGHAAGDRVLRQFAVALREAARSTDIIARLGGDEFGVLLIRCDERAAHSFIARLREAMAERAWPGSAPVGVSVGHASLQESSAPAKALHRAGRRDVRAQARELPRVGRFAAASAIQAPARNRFRRRPTARRAARRPHRRT